MKKASASMGGSTGALLGLVIGTLIPINGASLFTRLTGGAVMETTAVVMGVLYIGIAMLICGALGAIIGSLAE